jgi:hypothetical protein
MFSSPWVYLPFAKAHGIIRWCQSLKGMVAEEHTLLLQEIRFRYEFQQVTLTWMTNLIKGLPEISHGMLIY